MCGRVRLASDHSEIKIDLGLAEILRDHYEKRWNVPPTSMIPAIVSTNGLRLLEPMRWGLIPAWAKDNKMAFSTFNARADGVDTKPAFRGAWKAGRRCLVVIDGFYEWRKNDKQPYFVSLGNRAPMLLAGLWEDWRAPTGEKVRSCTIITTDANSLLGQVHDRMPVIIAPDDWPAWLGEKPASNDELKALLRPYPPERLVLWPVDRKVGNVRNESADLAEAITL
ncbi:MAG: SOS response-associated peptidase [Rhizobiales bacterium]|nr:SOS response-associated peptidase [Hyphomicrobiales bacterium]